MTKPEPVDLDAYLDALVDQAPLLDVETLAELRNVIRPHYRPEETARRGSARRAKSAPAAVPASLTA